MALVPNQADAADALGISEYDFKQMKALPGFPVRCSSGWDVDAIRAWIDAPTGQVEPTDSSTADSNVIPAADPETIPLPEVQQLPFPLPICPIHDAFIQYSRGHMEVRLRGRELQAFKCLQQGLVLEHATLNTGQPVGSASQVVRWLFSKLADDLGLPA